jgi:hypothetical protein
MPSASSQRTSVSVHVEQTEPPFYFVEPGTDFEFNVISSGLRVNHFDAVLGGINLNNDGPRRPSYQLIFTYRQTWHRAEPGQVWVKLGSDREISAQLGSSQTRARARRARIDLWLAWAWLDSS